MDRYERNRILMERIIRLVEEIIELCKKLQKNHINSPLVSQIVDSAGSVGANYSEACEAESYKDFIHKIKIAMKETNETKFFLRLLLKANPEFKDSIIKSGKEAGELLLIFSKIVAGVR